MKANYCKSAILVLFLSLICSQNLLLSQTKSKEFSATFTDNAWNGNTVPEGQQCQRFGGINPATPVLEVINIPKGTTAIIMEFCDRDYEPMDKGGHGIVGFKLPKGKKKVTIPSIPGHTTELPEGFWIVAEHKAPGWDTAGAYLPPCSGGKGHNYAIVVKAVKQLDGEKEVNNVLASFTLSMGKF